METKTIVKVYNWMTGIMVLLFWQKETTEESGLREQIDLLSAMLTLRCSGIFCNDWYPRDTWKRELRTHTNIYLEDICTEVIAKGIWLDQPSKKGGHIHRKDQGVILGKYLPHWEEWKRRLWGRMRKREKGGEHTPIDTRIRAVFTEGGSAARSHEWWEVGEKCRGATGLGH